MRNCMIAITHELFRAMSQAFMHLKQVRNQKECDPRSLAFAGPNEESERKEQYTARHHIVIASLVGMKRHPM